MYAVIDLETTGLHAGMRHRVVEVAVIHLDERGRVEREWCTLVNPERDLGPQSIHGITAAEVRRAPTFAAYAGQVAELLAGRVPVAHNLTFDAGFLRAEFARLGIDAPIHADLGLCTLRLAAHFFPYAHRTLRDCCGYAGIDLGQAHSALHDARAAAGLLGYYLDAVGDPPPWQQVIEAARAQRWPALGARAKAAPPPPVNRQAAGARQEHFLSRLVDRMPRLHEPAADAYLDLLDRALLDRYISAAEADDLVQTADAYGLARADVIGLHERYLTGLAAVAWDDGVVTDDERRDLDRVASLLGLGAEDVEQALKTAATEPPGSRSYPAWQLRRGDVVVFTGSMTPDRDHWVARAVSAGLQVADSVTKKRTRLLIAADPDSMSTKARQARKYGIPIVHPTAFQGMLDQLT
jgi:DNA polymerase-3 subunit epsilon